MKLSAYMGTFTKVTNFTGVEVPSDYILAVKIDPLATTETDYEVVYKGVETLEATLNSKTKTTELLYEGSSESKTGTSRSFKLTYIYNHASEFLNWLDSIKIKYGIGDTVVAEYVYVSTKTFMGEKGKLMFSVTKDGAMGEANFASQETPTHYEYTTP